RTPAGRAAGSGRRSARVRPSTWRAGRSARATWRTSRSDRARSTGEVRAARRAVPMVSRDAVAPTPPRVCHLRGCLVSTMGHGWRWDGMRITGTRKGPSLRAGCRGMALLIVTVGIGCDASTSPEVTEGLDMDGPEAVTLSDPNLD